jgi:hypothetical protein
MVSDGLYGGGSGLINVLFIMLQDQPLKLKGTETMKRTLLLFFVILFLLTLFVGCSYISKSTPNDSIISENFSGSSSDLKLQKVQESLNKLSNQNPLLAVEIGKLPDLQDEVSENELSAVQYLFDFYTENQKDFDYAFFEMYKEGLPLHRRYCSPLQAIFWLARDKEFDEVEHLVRNYKLETLLNLAWKINGNDRISKAEMKYVIDNMQNKNEKPFYQRHWENENYEIILEWFFRDLKRESKRDQKLFNEKSRVIIKSAKAKKDPVWSDFLTVRDRLNSPKLISFYINKYIKYRTYQRAQGVYSTFINKEGHCIDGAYFAESMLNAAGYKTFMRHVKWGPNNWTDNHCVSGVILEDGRYLVVGDHCPRGNLLSGPYDSVRDLDNSASRGRSIDEARWGTFWPPK